MFQPGNNLNFSVKFVKYDAFWRTNTIRCSWFRRDHRGAPGLGWVWVCDILATMDAPQVEEVGPSQFTQASPVGTQPTQPVGGATPAASGATSAGAGSSLVGGGTSRAKRHRPAEGHWMLQACRRRPWRRHLPTSSDRGWLGHLTPRRTPGTTPGLVLELLGRIGTDIFRCSSIFIMILYKLFASTRWLWHDLVTMLTLINLLFFKKVKSVLKMINFKKIKMALPPRGTAVRPTAVAHSGKVLASCHAALPPEVLSYRCTLRW
jgi:hypothetical protein